LCDEFQDEGSTYCGINDADDLCLGAESNNCNIADLWSGDLASSSTAYVYQLVGNVWDGPIADTLNNAETTRCIAKLDSTYVEPFKCEGENFMYIDALKLCVTKRNMGDKNNTVLTIPDEANVYTVDARTGSCSADTINCCWNGRTALDCDSANGGYSGCNRTVCNYNAANAICANFNYGGKTWRLPTKSELSKLIDYSIGLGSNGLMFCDDYSGYDSAQCAFGTGYCSGCEDNICGPNDIWASSKYMYGLVQGDWIEVLEDKSQANGVRCVTKMLN